MIDVKERFYSSSKETSFLEHLDDRDDVLWQALNFLAMFNNEKFKDEDSYFYHARIFITGRLINHILATYQLLKMGLEDESLIMLRQALELSWLLKCRRSISMSGRERLFLAMNGGNRGQ
jgi:hypothetical protein